jgi:hypothetical protein
MEQDRDGQTQGMGQLNQMSGAVCNFALLLEAVGLTSIRNLRYRERPPSWRQLDDLGRASNGQYFLVFAVQFARKGPQRRFLVPRNRFHWGAGTFGIADAF